MKISDIVGEEEKGKIDLLTIDEIEKTADLLEALATEDTLLDELAKLAVLQDCGKKIEKKAREIKETQLTTTKIIKETENLNKEN